MVGVAGGDIPTNLHGAPWHAEPHTAAPVVLNHNHVLCHPGPRRHEPPPWWTANWLIVNDPRVGKVNNVLCMVITSPRCDVNKFLALCNYHEIILHKYNKSWRDLSVEHAPSKWFFKFYEDITPLIITVEISGHLPWFSIQRVLLLVRRSLEPTCH